jgi:tetratricopeptide (TPR) repeat protein
MQNLLGFHGASSMAGRLIACAAALAACAVMLAAASPVSAQEADGDPDGGVRTISRAVVQPLPDTTGMTLNDALGRLGRNPRDVQALIGAGNAALAMGDVDAATGFFRRADQISPGNARVKAGLAGAYVRSGNPFEAIPLFQEAERAGALDSALAADRGLAYDLVGDNAAAQALYKLALARGPDEEISRRLALSQAIAGDRKGSEATLTPLLRLQDKASWRTRAFALAILGEPEQAVTIAKTILPPDLAAAMSPYLRYMPRLTPAQQAAAANFGSFPRASEIGRDDPRVALYAPAGGRRPALASADARLIPSGEALGSKRPRDDRQARRERRAAEQQRAAAARQSQQQVARVAPGEVLPGIVSRDPAPQVASAGPAGKPRTPAVKAPQPAAAPPRVARAELPPAAARPAPATTSVASASPARVSAPAKAAPAPATAPPPAKPASSPAIAPSMSGPVAPSAMPPPGFDLASIAARQEPRLAPSPASNPPASGAAAPTVATAAPAAPPQVAAASPARAAPPPKPQSLSDAFSDFSRPAVDVTPAAGAVDIRRIAPARVRPTPVVKPVRAAPPSHPSRIWVQIATGRDKAALAFDWRRMGRQASDIFKGKQSFVAAWGQTNRLLTGPFESERAANAFIVQLRRSNIDGAFVWTSPAGQVVDQLGGK